MHQQNFKVLVVEDINADYDLLHNELSAKGYNTQIVELRNDFNLKYFSFTDYTTDLISIHELSGDILYASPAIVELTGYSPEEVIGRKLSEFFHIEDAAQLRSQLDSILDNKNKLRFEYRLLKKDGSYIWIETSGRLLFDEITKQPKEIISVTRDATDRMLNTQRIKTSEEQYRLIAENATDMITRHDLDGVYNYVSNSSYTMLGYNTTEMIGKSAYQFLHPDDAIAIKNGLHDFVDKGLGIYTASYRYQKKNGDYIWIESTNKLTYVENTNQIQGIISISRDISDRKAFEIKLEDKIKELDTFIYRSSHDLKGPLSSLQGLLNIAKTEIVDESAVQYFSLIEKSVHNLDSILMDLLNITKITQGFINLVDININEVILNIISSFENLPEYAYVHWELNLDKDIKLRLDKSLVNNIFQNLIINAIKYQDSSKPKCTIKISTFKKNNELMVQIEDNGEGIPENLQRNVFDMFFRGNTKSSGTGLGLYIVKNAVEKSGGRIILESEENRGTIFTVYLPLNNNLDTPISKLAKNTVI
jgi:PAS domain S-box-containing protein